MPPLRKRYIKKDAKKYCNEQSERSELRLFKEMKFEL